MNRYVMEEYYRSPLLQLHLESAARRERAKAIAAGFSWLVRKIKDRLTPRVGTSGWLARLG